MAAFIPVAVIDGTRQFEIRMLSLLLVEACIGALYGQRRYGRGASAQYSTLPPAAGKSGA